MNSLVSWNRAQESAYRWDDVEEYPQNNEGSRDPLVGRRIQERGVASGSGEVGLSGAVIVQEWFVAVLWSTLRSQLVRSGLVLVMFESCGWLLVS